MNDDKILSLAKDVLTCEANSILSVTEKMDENFVKAVKVILSHKGKIVICGLGKSGLVGMKIAATMSSTGTPAVFMHACDATHGDLGIFEAGDPTILISNSGATGECVRLIPILKSLKSPTIAMVGNLDSPMAKECDIVLDISSNGEADPLGIVPTSSTTVTLAMGDALACALIKARNFSKEDFARFHPAGQLGRNLLFTVANVMHEKNDCAVAKSEMTVREVVIEMTKKPLGAACVVDDDNKVVGFITDGDLRRMLQTVVDLDALKCKDIMTTSPISIRAEASLGKAIELMEVRKSKISVLPVVDEYNTFIGLIRIHDIYQPQ